ncbi:hypothetical protein LJC21_00030 [Bacteroides sp. OttesenSCG-928-E20]|nr:hypothetical protein [Bacteroides sp. OttesenSCG-928-N06]MDL2299079.1 hypothetical protein [Bacteroides sp. OttesenSCG-928-E20]
MINLGRYKATGLPNVHLPLTALDWVLTGLAVALMLTIWVLIALFYPVLSVRGYDFFASGGASVLITVLFIWSARAPVRFINFPVRVHEQNIERQYFLMSRFMRVITVVMNLLFLFVLLGNLEAHWGIKEGTFAFVSFAILAILVASFVVYYVMAMRWR